MPALTELSKLQHTLADGTRLLPLELVFIELLRQRRSDAYIRGCLNMSQGLLLRLSAGVRRKLGVALTSTIRAAANRHGIPRLDI